MAITWLDQVDSEELAAKNVLCRVDFNVPMDSEGNVLDATRIEMSLPTIKRLIEAKAKVVLISHLGRPKGKQRPALSLEPVANYLRDLLNQEIVFIHDCVGDGVTKILANQEDGSVTFLENLRFHGGEEKNDLVFAKMLARNMDCYVNDAFGTSHRAHASVVGAVKHFSKVYGGLLLKKEIETLNGILKDPKKPFVAIVGGAKVSSKLGVLSKLLNKVDKLIIGGGMAYTLLKAQGQKVGASLVEEDKLVVAKSFLNKAAQMNVEVLLPVDHLVCSELENLSDLKTIEANQFKPEDIGIDIGPESIKQFLAAIKNAATVFFNGTLGITEHDEACHGTKAVMEQLAASMAFTVVGGGDSIAALKKFGLADKINFVSSGGGACLELIEEKKLPGLESLGFY